MAAAKAASVAVAVALAASVAAVLSSCGQADATAYTPRQIAEAIIASQAAIPALQPSAPEDAEYSDRVIGTYSLDADMIEDGAIFYPGGVDACEIAVFLLSDPSYADEAQDGLTKYISGRARVFAGYAPQQAAMLEKSIVAKNGGYVALLACDDPNGALSTFLACFSDKPPELPASIAEAVGEGPPGRAAATPNPHVSAADEASQASASQASASQDAASQNEAPLLSPTQAPLPSPTQAPLPPPTQEPEPTTTQAPEPTTTQEPLPSPTPALVAVATLALEPAPTPAPELEPTPAQESEDAPTQPGTAGGPSGSGDYAYDPDAILAAWRGAAAAATLQEKDRSVYDACAKAIGELAMDSMGDYEKELAIHDWMVGWADYDTESMSNAPDAKPDPDNSNPYGLLISRKAICMGYTSTFKLFMDMLGIECMIVEGFSHGDAEHAWNMVRIGGIWHCVDVTWDDPIGQAPLGQVSHAYFNVTSEFMRQTKHSWDYGAVPEATVEVSASLWAGAGDIFG